MLLKMMLLKRCVYKLAARVNNVDTSTFVLKTKYQTDKAELEKKIPDVTNFVGKTKLQKTQNSKNQKTNFQTLVVQQQKLH